MTTLVETVTLDTLLALFRRLAQHDPAWLLRLLAYLIGDALLSLETALLNGDVSWETPYLETHLYPLAEDWIRHPTHTTQPLIRVPQDAPTVIAQLTDLLSAHADDLLDAERRGRAAALRRFPHNLLALLAVVPEAELQEISAYLYPSTPTRTGEHDVKISTSTDNAEGEDSSDSLHLPTEIITAPYKDHPHLAFNEKFRFPQGRVELSVQFYPLLMDRQSRQPFLPTLIGVKFEDDYQPQQMTPTQQSQVWKTLRTTVLDLILAIHQGDSTRIQEITGYPQPRWTYFATVSNAVSPTPGLVRPPFYVAFGPAPQSDQARQIVNAAYPIQLPNNWSNLKRWEDIKNTEIQRLLKVDGDDSPSLKAHYRPDGTVILDLRAEVERDIKLRHSQKNGYIDLDEYGREYLVRSFEVGSGIIEIGLSWQGLAGPFINEWLDLTKQQINRGAYQMSFDEITDEARQQIDLAMSRIRIWEHGRRVMEMILGQVGRQRHNPIEIPAEAFRVLLWPSLSRSRAWPRNWKRDVEGILEGLRTVNFRYQAHRTAPLKGKGMGSFIGEWSYIPRGKGSHGNGVYVIDVQRGFLGCLYVFINGTTRLANGHEAFFFDFEKELTKEERQALGWESSQETVDTFSIADANRPFITAALDFTPPQENFLRWLDQELTLRRDPVHPNGHTHRLPPHHRDAKAYRLYTSKFCPLLKKNEELAGTLGHFNRNPEVGFTLGGAKRRGGKAGKGLLSVMGYTLPPERAHAKTRDLINTIILDIKQVVESHLEGKVIGHYNDQWLIADQFTSLPLQDTLHRLRVYCFVPADYNEKLLTKWEQTVGFTAIDDPDRAKAEYWGNAVPSSAKQLVAPAETAITASPVPLHIHLYDTMKQRNLRQQDIGTIFGVSGASVTYWLKGTDPDADGVVRGRPIPEELRPLVLRWIEQAIAPGTDELAGLKSRRSGKKKRKST